LPMQQHVNLKFLLFRLDFTEYYSRVSSSKWKSVLNVEELGDILFSSITAVFPHWVLDLAFWLDLGYNFFTPYPHWLTLGHLIGMATPIALHHLMKAIWICCWWGFQC
jgi:hypothetical protein